MRSDCSCFALTPLPGSACYRLAVSLAHRWRRAPLCSMVPSRMARKSGIVIVRYPILSASSGALHNRWRRRPCRNKTWRRRHRQALAKPWTRMVGFFRASFSAAFGDGCAICETTFAVCSAIRFVGQHAFSSAILLAARICRRNAGGSGDSAVHISV